MALKNTADLTTENSSEIISAVAPESITPAVLGGNIQDIIDSMWNKADWNVDDLVIPVSLNGQITGPPRSPINILQVLLNNIDQIMAGGTNSANQGRPGLFLGYVGVNQQLVEAIPGAANLSHGKLLFTNDYELGGFDNGNNWSTFNYKVPQGGFNGKVIMTSMEMETVVAPTFADTAFRFQMLKNGVATGMPNVEFTFGNSFAVGDKMYTPLMQMDFSAAPLVEGDVISVEIQRPTPNFSSPLVGTFKINAGSISNED